MKRIESRENPAFKALRALATDPRRQRDERRTLIDGPHLLAAALDHGLQPELIVLDEGALAHPEITVLLERARAVETLCLRTALFRELSELATPLGVLARIAVPEETADWPDGDCLLLDAVQDAGNVGTLLRTAAAAGVTTVLLGTGCAAAWSPRVLRAAQGAHFGLRLRERVDLAAFLDGYAGQSVATVAHAGQSLYDLALGSPVAWLMGNEGAGLAPPLIAKATRRVTIPLAPGCESLNVGAAAAICLFEMRRQRMCHGTTIHESRK